jgi:hypothetical protein
MYQARRNGAFNEIKTWNGEFPALVFPATPDNCKMPKCAPAMQLVSKRPYISTTWTLIIGCDRNCSQAGRYRDCEVQQQGAFRLYMPNSYVQPNAATGNEIVP